MNPPSEAILRPPEAARPCNRNEWYRLKAQVFALGFQAEKEIRQITEFVSADDGPPLGHEVGRLGAGGFFREYCAHPG